MNDPIIDEIRQYREAYAASFNYDLDAMYEDIKKRENETKQRIQEHSSHTGKESLSLQSVGVTQAVGVTQVSPLPAKRAS